MSKITQYVRQGSKLIVPETVGLSQVIKDLQAIEKAEESPVSVSETFEVHPCEGAVAFAEVMVEEYGGFLPDGTAGPVHAMRFEVAYGKYAEAIFGFVAVPGVSGMFLVSSGKMGATGPVYCIEGQIKQKNVFHVQRIAEALRRKLASKSIYRGKAFRLTLKDGDAIHPTEAPHFLNTAQTDVEQLILNKNLELKLDAELLTIIRRTEECRRAGIPLKRGILFAGPYGTGKTTAATIIARVCEENAWTFMLVPDARAFVPALTYAKRYPRCVVFVEDIDRRFQGAERTADVDEILNALDGVDSKNNEMIVVMTTNDPENIHPAMRREGRLDSKFAFVPPNAEAAARLIKYYLGALAQDDVYPQGGATLAGQIPAKIREACERGKLYAMVENRHLVNDQDLKHAGEALLAENKLFEAEPKPELPTLDQVLRFTVREALNGTKEAVARTETMVESLNNRL